MSYQLTTIQLTTIHHELGNSGHDLILEKKLSLVMFMLCYNDTFTLMFQVHDKFDLMHETLFLTINLIDRFLAKQNVIRKKLQLVGLVAMLLACKYEEVSVPVVGDLILISDKAYTRKEILEMVTFNDNFSF